MNIYFLNLPCTLHELTTRTSIVPMTTSLGGTWKLLNKNSKGSFSAFIKLLYITLNKVFEKLQGMGLLRSLYPRLMLNPLPKVV